jgi:D,D-heptose 1,7-bisphosphate phosphatase
VKQAVILAGGKGTRLKSVSGDFPKPMVPILGKPVLQHLIEQCANYGFLDLHLLVSYKFEVIEEFFGDGSQFGLSIQYHKEEVPMGTAGALLNLMPQLNERFLVLYGDTYFEIDLSRFWDFHEVSNGDVSLFLHPNDHPQDSDLVEVDNNFRITAIHGYPHGDEWRRNLVNAALYVVNKSCMINVKLQSERPDIAKVLFPFLLQSCCKLHGYISTEYIKDMGTPERLSAIEHDIISGKVESLKQTSKKKAIFLDRDGVLNQEVDHLSRPEQLELIPGVGEAVRKANRAGVLVVVVTNQPVVARGALTESGLQIIHNKLDTLLGIDGAYIDRLYYCPHHQDSGFDGEVLELKTNCSCRKPKPGLLFQAAEELNISLENSWMIGDRTSDILAGESAGSHTILVNTGYGGNDRKYSVVPDFVVKNLTAAVDHVLQSAE